MGDGRLRAYPGARGLRWHALCGVGQWALFGGQRWPILAVRLHPRDRPRLIACNYTEVCVAANNTGYVWSGGTLQTPVPFPVSSVIYADGYMLWTIADSEQFCISGLDTAVTNDASDIASVEGAPDNLKGVVNSHREILFFGDLTTEIYYNSGAVQMPFERQGSAFIERGIFDRDSAVKIDNSVTFVGDDRIVYSMNGYSPQRISTHAIEYLLRDATYARAWTYSLEGHNFYVLECDNGTACFDHATGAWHLRRSIGSTWWRCNGAIDAYGKTLLTDRDTGAIYIPSNDVLTEDGATIRVEITLPTMQFGRERATMYAFEATVETGRGNTAAPVPQIMLRYSDDGGHRWSNEWWLTPGAVGDTRRRAIWRKLGQFRTRQIQIAMTDPYYRMVIAYWADVR